MVLLLTGATDYNFDQLNFDAAIDPFAICTTKLSNAAGFSPAVLKEMHTKDHRSFLTG
ncbi:MAG TPA: hypothetical protein PLL71_03830 [Agriterribacter sp.]|nr:hypothetical protein [Agriterribacter sp.]